MMWHFLSLVILVFNVTESKADSGFKLNQGSYTCSFSQPQYTRSEMKEIAKYQACKNKKIEGTKIDFSKFGSCMPPTIGSNLQIQGRVNRAWLCADSHYDQRYCIQEANADPSFKEMIATCRERRVAETLAFQESNRMRVELEKRCARSFAKGYLLNSVEECRLKIALPPPPSAH
jgi:hypothetical protein